MNDIPYVSVIIPVYNDPDGVKRCLKALHAQQYPSERFEIIVVDNNSTPPLCPELSPHPNVRCLVEGRRGSYAARNRGIAEASGEVFAFTDADCTPAPDWIEEGVKALETEQAAVAAGAVEFTFQGKEPNPWEYYDASTYLNQEKDVSEKGVASTANLFIRREMIEKFGPFKADLQSGGDYELTSRMREKGGKLIFAEHAVVMHPARSTFSAIFRRDRRVLEGSVVMRRKKGSRINFPSNFRSYVPTKTIPNPGARELSFVEKMSVYVVFNTRRCLRTYYQMKHAILQRIDIFIGL